ncbi:MAG TPA: glycosyltransferase WbuB [Deltaproteobacteria bacterium]|nr:glycosyltransferase WbuB [Deltaproteobacteria bacterium]
MNILLVTDSYPPEIRSASHLMLELAEELNNRNYQVTVITTWPEYNLDQDFAQRRFSEMEVENGITVLRVKTLPHHNINYLLRGVAQLFMPVQFLWKLRQHRIQPDALVVYSPPLPLALVGCWFGRKKSRFVLNLQDLFPQNAIDLGVLSNPLQIRFFRALEGVAYSSADVVTVHSDGNQKTVLQQHPYLENKLRILHNWVDVEHHQTDIAHTDFRSKWKIKQKHVAVFAGVIGPSQYLELLLHIATQMQDETELLFLLVGDGMEKEKLQKLVREKSLNNVRFEGFVSREEYPDLLRICSIGLVCLSPQNQTPVVPGKILGYMAAGLPVAAFLQSSSDGHGVVKSAQCGFSADSADKDACVQAMQGLMSHSDAFAELGQKGKCYATEHFSKEVCVSQLESMLRLATT